MIYSSESFRKKAEIKAQELIDKHGVDKAILECGKRITWLETEADITPHHEAWFMVLDSVKRIGLPSPDPYVWFLNVF